MSTFGEKWYGSGALESNLRGKTVRIGNQTVRVSILHRNSGDKPYSVRVREGGSERSREDFATYDEALKVMRSFRRSK